MTCPDCEKYILQGKRFCGTCGKDFSKMEEEKCPDCEKNRALGHNYCSSCGAILSGTTRVTSLLCPDCESYRQEGCKYCGTCGGYLIRDTSRPRYRNDLRLLKPCVFIAALLAVIEIAAAWWNVPFALTGDGLSIQLLYITPEPRLLVELTGIPMKIWYLVLCAVITFCAVLCGKRFVEARGRREDPLDTAMVSVPVLLGMCLAIEFFIIIVSGAFGDPSAVPEDFNDRAAVLSLVNASVWEEIIARVALIGLPMMVIMLLVTRGDTDLPWYRYLIGGFGYSRIAFLLVIISAIIFGCGHYNWGLWKVLPTILAGVVMGYVFMKYGLYASITMHFLTDLAIVPVYMNMALGSISSLLLIAMILLALPGFVIYGRRLHKDYKEGLL